MDEATNRTHPIIRWFKGLVSILDALDVLVLGALLFFFGMAILVGPYILARDLLAGTLVIPAVVVTAASVACVFAIGVAWYHRGLRWWYFALLLLVSATVTQLGRSYFAV
jgi:hypothetical protein